MIKFQSKLLYILLAFEINITTIYQELKGVALNRLCFVNKVKHGTMYLSLSESRRLG